MSVAPALPAAAAEKASKRPTAARTARKAAQAATTAVSPATGAAATPPQHPWTQPLAAVSEAASGQRLAQDGVAAEKLGPIYIDGTGPMVAARAGDWRLYNDKVCLTFAAAEDVPTTGSHPVAGWVPYPEQRAAATNRPGALIDVQVAGTQVDVLASFTQGVGTDPNGQLVRYDTITPVKRPGEVGLKLEGSPFPNAPLRMETTYWLGQDASFVTIETRLLDVPAGVPLAPFVDAADWGSAATFIEDKGFTAGTKPLPFSAWGLYAGASNVNILLQPAGGRLLGMVRGVSPLSRTLLAGADAATSPSLAAGKPADALARDQAWLDAATSHTQLPVDGIYKRRLWFAHGTQGDVRTLAQRGSGIPLEHVEGHITDGKGHPAAHSPFVVLRSAPGSDAAPAHYTSGQTDATGAYNIELPRGHYFLQPTTRYNQGVFGMLRSFDVAPGKPLVRKEADIVRFHAMLHVRVVDDATSQPLAAELILQGPGGERLPLGPGTSASGAGNLAFCPPEGITLEVPSAQFLIVALHGIEYELVQQDAEAREGATTELTLRLKKIPILPGWSHFVPGLRTWATPGNSVSPQDAVLMAAAAGVQWITSGDFETVTDFSPAIRQAGLAHLLQASRGFRTAVPAHPEWGQFLLYPIAADAPDPATARTAWAHAKTRHELLQALRKAYPGALIQAELPYAPGGDGFLGFGIANSDVAAHEPHPSEDLTADALMLYPNDRAWDLGRQLRFFEYNYNLNRVYLFSTSVGGRTVSDAIPGFPRLLVKTGATGLPTEKALFAALRAHAYELSSGPFADFQVRDSGSGALIPFNESDSFKLRITSPYWTKVTGLSIDKEGETQQKMILNLNEGLSQVLPEDQSQQYLLGTLKDLRLFKDKDTLLNVQVIGQISILNIVRGGMLNAPFLPAYAVTWPITIDRNGDKKYTAPPFIWVGR